MCRGVHVYLQGALFVEAVGFLVSVWMCTKVESMTHMFSFRCVVCDC